MEITLQPDQEKRKRKKKKRFSPRDLFDCFLEKNVPFRIHSWGCEINCIISCCDVVFIPTWSHFHTPSPLAAVAVCLCGLVEWFVCCTWKKWVCAFSADVDSPWHSLRHFQERERVRWFAVGKFIDYLGGKDCKHYTFGVIKSAIMWLQMSCLCPAVTSETVLREVGLDCYCYWRLLTKPLAAIDKRQ